MLRTAEKEIWLSLLDFYVGRIDAYVRNLRKALAKVQEVRRGSDQSGNIEAMQDLEEFRKLCNVPSECARSNGRTLESLVLKAYEVRHSRSVEEFIRHLQRRKEVGDLWTILCFLRRIRKAYQTFVNAASQLLFPRNINITCVKKPAILNNDILSERLDLAEALGLLSKMAQDKATARIRQKKWSKDKAKMEFNQMQEQQGHIHAEAQILLYLEAECKTLQSFRIPF